jgi:hypothetical protein
LWKLARWYLPFWAINLPNGVKRVKKEASFAFWRDGFRCRVIRSCFQACFIGVHYYRGGIYVHSGGIGRDWLVAQGIYTLADREAVQTFSVDQVTFLTCLVPFASHAILASGC